MSRQKVSKTTAKALQALKLRAAGYTYQQIAEKLGYSSKSGAHSAVMRQLQQIPAENLEQVRSLELDRLDSLQQGLWPEAFRGNTKSVEAFLKVMAHRARILGLDANDAKRADAVAEYGATLEKAFVALTTVISGIGLTSEQEEMASGLLADQLEKLTAG